MSFLRGWLLDNLGLKFTALVLAVLVYLNVYLNRPATMLVSFPLEFTDLGDSLTLSGPAPAVVQAVLRGTGKQLIGVRVREPRLKVSLLGVAPGRFERALDASDLPLPGHGSITVDNLVGPRVVAVEIDHRAARDVPIKVQVEGTPAPGFTWTGGAVLEPATVHLTGPAKALHDLDSLALSPISLAGRRDTVRADVGPERLPDWVRADPPVVRVRLPLTHRGS